MCHPVQYNGKRSQEGEAGVATTTWRSGRREQARIATLPESARIALLVGAFVLYYFAPGLPLSLLLLAVCAVLCYVQLPLAVSLVPLAMPFFMLPKHLGHPNPEFSLGETALLLCTAAYVLRRALEPPPHGQRYANLLRRFIPASPLERSVALFFVAATVATLAAHFRHEALRQYRWTVLEPLAYYVLVVALLRETRAMARALWAVVAAGALVAALGLGQYVFHPETLSGSYWVGHVMYPLHLVTSVYGSPNNLGLLLDRAIPVAVVLGVALLILARRQEPDATPRAAYLALAAVAPMAAVLVLSNSRAGIITAAAVSLAAALLWRGKRAPRLELAGGIVVVLGAALVLWKARHGLSTVARLHVWLSGLKMIRDHPLFGVGPDNFLYYYVNPSVLDPHNSSLQGCIAAVKAVTLPAKHYMDTVNAWQEPCLSHPHNIVLDAWLSAGFVGLVALILVGIGFVLLSWRNVQWSRLGPARTVQVACIAIVAATVVHGMVDNSIFVPDLAVLLWLALALTANLDALRKTGAV